MQESRARLRLRPSRAARFGIGLMSAPLGVLMVAELVMIAALPVSLCWAQAPQKTEVYFAQGQAMYYPNDRARSQLEATQDLISSGVMQAVAGVLGPASTQSLFGIIQEKILANKERYVGGHQLASEGLVNGLYRVTGQVTISKDLLLQDLREHGFHVPPPAQSRVGELVGDKSTRIDLSPPQEPESGRPGQGPVHSKPRVVWAVAENMEAKWVLPEGGDEVGLPPFARSVLEQARNLKWAPRFVPAGSLQPDKQGNFKHEEVLALSRETGLNKAVIGKSWLDASQPGSQRLLASLEIVDVSTGSSEGEVHEERPLEGATVEEGIVRLAESVLLSVDAILFPSQELNRREGDSDTRRGLGDWTLTIRASHPQSAWEVVRKEVEAMYRGARTTGFEMEVSRIKVQIEGVDGRSLRDALDGREISPGGPVVRIEEFSEEGQSMVVVFGEVEERQ